MSTKQNMSTPGPWTVEDYTHEKPGSYISIRGPNGEKIADIFPFAGVGGVGVEQARENAALIVRAVALSRGEPNPT